MSVIKIEDIGYVRFRAPDLDEMTGFLADGIVSITKITLPPLYFTR